MAGLPVSGAHLNQRMGQICNDLRRNYEDVFQINEYFLAHPIAGGVDPLVVALALDAADLVTLRAAAADLAYQKDASFGSSTPVKQLWGIGS